MLLGRMPQLEKKTMPWSHGERGCALGSKANAAHAGDRLWPGAASAAGGRRREVESLDQMPDAAVFPLVVFVVLR